MNRKTLDELKRLCEEATEGPWKNKCFPGGWDGVTCPTVGAICALRYNNPPNAAFIAASRTAIPELIEGIERLVEYHNLHNAFWQTDFSAPETSLSEASAKAVIAKHNIPDWIKEMLG